MKSFIVSASLILVVFGVILIMLIAATFYKEPQEDKTKCINGYMFVLDKTGVHQIIDMSGNGLPCIKEEK